MNNKGFTLVELIVTFALATVIITILFNVVIGLACNMNNSQFSIAHSVSIGFQ